MAIPYEASMPGLGGEPFVRKATVEFHASARLDDQLEVGLKCARIGTSSMGFVGGIFRDEQLLISSELVYVFADPIAQVSVPVPPRLREIMLGYEACEPMTCTEVGAWPTLAAELLSLRQEAGLAAAEDPGDAAAVHVLLRNRLGLPVACGRLLPAVAGVSTIDRLGVHRVLRGSHYGRATLIALLKAAEGRGEHTLQVHAPRGSRVARQSLSGCLGQATTRFHRWVDWCAGLDFQNSPLVLDAGRHVQVARTIGQVDPTCAVKQIVGRGDDIAVFGCGWPLHMVQM
eukprot:gene21911-42092_t